MKRIFTLFAASFFFVSLSYAQPGTPASNIVLSAGGTGPTATSAYLVASWTAGSGANRLVILKTGASTYVPLTASAAPLSIGAGSPLSSAFPVDGGTGDLDA